jgi:hypothetical protein
VSVLNQIYQSDTCGGYAALIFFKYQAHSRRAPPKPVIYLLCLTSIIITSLSLLQLFNQKTAAKKAKLYEAASERSSLNQSWRKENLFV